MYIVYVHVYGRLEIRKIKQPCHAVTAAAPVARLGTATLAQVFLSCSRRLHPIVYWLSHLEMRPNVRKRPASGLGEDANVKPQGLGRMTVSRTCCWRTSKASCVSSSAHFLASCRSSARRSLPRPKTLLYVTASRLHSWSRQAALELSKEAAARGNLRVTNCEYCKAPLTARTSPRTSASFFLWRACKRAASACCLRCSGLLSTVSLLAGSSRPWLLASAEVWFPGPPRPALLSSLSENSSLKVGSSASGVLLSWCERLLAALAGV